jgi:hypothetical protein
MSNRETRKEKKDRGPKLEFTVKKIITPKFRGQFVHRLFEPDDDKYSICAIWEPDADRTEMKNEILRVAKEALGGFRPGMKKPFRDGAEKVGEYEGFTEDNKFCNLGSYKRPGIRDTQRHPIDEDSFEEGDIKSGDYFKASVYAKPFVHKGKKGVSFVLCSLLWVEAGDALFKGGVASDPLDDFADEFVDSPDAFDEGQADDANDGGDMSDLVD